MNATTVERGGFRARLVPQMRKGAQDGWIVDLTRPDGSRVRTRLKVRPDETEQDAFRKWCGFVFERLAAGSDSERQANDIGPTIREVVDHYLLSYLPAKNSAKASIVRATGILYDFERFCAARKIGRTGQLTPATVDAWAAMIMTTRSPKTCHNSLSALRAAINAAVDRDMIPASPIRKWLMPSVPEVHVEPLTPEQLRAVLSIIRAKAPTIAPLITWMAYTGQRPSDAVTLAWADVDVSRRIVVRRQEKTKRLATFEISPQAVRVLESVATREKSRDGTVFLSSYGLPFSKNTVYNEFTRCLRRNKFERPVNLKDLRHTFGSIMANEMRCPLPILQRLMGHKQVDTTMRYIRPGNGSEYVEAFGDLIA